MIAQSMQKQQTAGNYDQIVDDLNGADYPKCDESKISDSKVHNHDKVSLSATLII